MHVEFGIIPHLSLPGHDSGISHLAAALGFLTPSQVARLECRNRRLECLEHYYCAKERLAASDLPGASALVLEHPAMFGYLLRSLSRRYLNRPGSAAVQRVAMRARTAS